MPYYFDTPLHKEAYRAFVAGNYMGAWTAYTSALELLNRQIAADRGRQVPFGYPLSHVLCDLIETGVMLIARCKGTDADFAKMKDIENKIEFYVREVISVCDTIGDVGKKQEIKARIKHLRASFFANCSDAYHRRALAISKAELVEQQPLLDALDYIKKASQLAINASDIDNGNRFEYFGDLNHTAAVVYDVLSDLSMDAPSANDDALIHNIQQAIIYNSSARERLINDRQDVHKEFRFMLQLAFLNMNEDLWRLTGHQEYVDTIANGLDTLERLSDRRPIMRPDSLRQEEWGYTLLVAIHGRNPNHDLALTTAKNITRLPKDESSASLSRVYDEAMDYIRRRREQGKRKAPESGFGPDQERSQEPPAKRQASVGSAGLGSSSAAAPAPVVKLEEVEEAPCRSAVVAAGAGSLAAAAGVFASRQVAVQQVDSPIYQKQFDLIKQALLKELNLDSKQIAKLFAITADYFRKVEPEYAEQINQKRTILYKRALALLSAEASPHLCNVLKDNINKAGGSGAFPNVSIDNLALLNRYFKQHFEKFLIESVNILGDSAPGHMNAMGIYIAEQMTIGLIFLSPETRANLKSEMEALAVSAAPAP